MTYDNTIPIQKRRCHVKNDQEVRLYMQERQKGVTQKVAAARAGMSERTARKYEQTGSLPSEIKRPHDWHVFTSQQKDPSPKL